LNEESKKSSSTGKDFEMVEGEKKDGDDTDEES